MIRPALVLCLALPLAACGADGPPERPERLGAEAGPSGPSDPADADADAVGSEAEQRGGPPTDVR